MRLGWSALDQDYFSLSGSVTEVDEPTLVARLASAQASYRDLLYKPETLRSPYHPWRFRVKDAIFSNVSFKHTTISDFEFTNCRFERCLFIGTIFHNCRFTSCRFVGCNPHRIEFEDCFIDPVSFVECILDRRYANIGVYLFQELLRNSRRQGQPDFADEAQYRFRKWQRFQLRERLRGANRRGVKIQLSLSILGLLAFDLTTGSGMRFRRLAASSISVLFLTSLMNWVFAVCFGITDGKTTISSFSQALYFSVITLTTVGFGDIVPTTPIGRLFVGGEAIFGFFLFALLTSTLYRRFSS